MASSTISRQNRTRHEPNPLETCGYHVLRIPNDAVLNDLDSVLRRILGTLWEIRSRNRQPT